MKTGQECVLYVQLEELRADIVDLKEMYREQVDLLVNQVKSKAQRPFGIILVGLLTYGV